MNVSHKISVFIAKQRYSSFLKLNSIFAKANLNPFKPKYAFYLLVIMKIWQK